MSRPKPPSLPDYRLRRALEGLANRIQDPGAKLWFLQRAQERYQGQPAFLRRATLLPSLLQRAAAHLACFGAFDELRRRPGLVPKPNPPQFGWSLYRARHGILVLILVGTAFLISTFGQAGYQGAVAGIGYLVERWPPVWAGASSGTASASRRGQPGADYPPGRLGPPPEKVWLVEEGPQGELWSNGARILTSYRVRTEPRRYLVFSRKNGEPTEVKGKPVGIVYHTSQSDMAPFEPGQNGKILRNTRGLLRWLRKHGNYHYLIDRFGRIYRLVDDSDLAHHAGKSIWADEDYYYLDLNDSFLGVCFESEWKAQAGAVELLTPAQIQAGMNLTDVLRDRYDIRDANTVPHGLISVNPKKMLIGHHLDWAKGFPFAPLGLTNKYEVPLPSITGFGFSYDEHLVRSMGGDLWPGIKKAEAGLRRHAADLGVSPSTLRNELRKNYLRHQRLLEAARKNDATMAAGLGSS